MLVVSSTLRGALHGLLRNSMGKFQLDGTPPAPRGGPQIEQPTTAMPNDILNMSIAECPHAAPSEQHYQRDGRLSGAEIDHIGAESRVILR